MLRESPFYHHMLLMTSEVEFYVDPLLKRPPPFKGLDIRIPIIIPIKGRGFVNQGSGLGFRFQISTLQSSTEILSLKPRSAKTPNPLNSTNLAESPEALNPKP